MVSLKFGSIFNIEYTLDSFTYIYLKTFKSSTSRESLQKNMNGPKLGTVQAVIYIGAESLTELGDTNQ